MLISCGFTQILYYVRFHENSLANRAFGSIRHEVVRSFLDLSLSLLAQKCKPLIRLRTRPGWVEGEWRVGGWVSGRGAGRDAARTWGLYAIAGNSWSPPYSFPLLCIRTAVHRVLSGAGNGGSFCIVLVLYVFLKKKVFTVYFFW